MSDKQIIAAFDFDGTITYHDSLLPFLTFTYGTIKTYGKLLLLAPTLIGFVLGIVKRQQAKEAILSSFFKGKSIETIQNQGKKYAKKRLNELVRPEARDRIKWHLDRGHHCVLISASLDIYLAPWAKTVGFKNVICSRLQTSDTKVITGKLNGANCWGPEKVRRLQEACGPRNQYTLYAYGDSRGDQELLETADHAFFKSMDSSE
jgi:phosphatidylglycerophosphatase C